MRSAAAAESISETRGGATLGIWNENIINRLMKTIRYLVLCENNRNLFPNLNKLKLSRCKLFSINIRI